MALTPTGSKNTDSKKKPAEGDMAPEDQILMREIDDAVRQDDTQHFFKKYGIALGSAVLLLLAAFGGYLLWDNAREAALEEQSETLVRALDQSQGGDFSAASETVASLLDSDESGPRTAARFIKAAAALEQDNTAEAVEIYARIAADEDAPPALRDLARIREVASNFDDREPSDVIARLDDLAVPGNAFFGSAGELVANAHLEAGNRDQAGALFAAIAKDEEIPETLRSRARQMAGLLGVDAIEDVEKLLEDEGIDPEAGMGPLPGAPPGQ